MVNQTMYSVRIFISDSAAAIERYPSLTEAEQAVAVIERVFPQAFCWIIEFDRTTGDIGKQIYRNY